MTLRDGISERAIERRLGSRPALAPSAGHRSRVLAAVREVLESRPLAEAVGRHRLGGGGVLALAGMAAAIAPLLVGPWWLSLAAVAGGVRLIDTNSAPCTRPFHSTGFAYLRPQHGGEANANAAS